MSTTVASNVVDWLLFQDSSRRRRYVAVVLWMKFFQCRKREIESTFEVP